MFAVDLVLLRFPTIIVTIGSACEWNVGMKIIEKSNCGKISEAKGIKTIIQSLVTNLDIGNKCMDEWNYLHVIVAFAVALVHWIP